MNEIENYLEQVDDKRSAGFYQLYNVIKENIPAGFEQHFAYGMINFVVPLSRYKAGYLGRVDEPIPFISLAAQKNHIAVYHMGIMADPKLLEWFQEEYKNQVPTKLNMGKSCIRLTNVKNIPYDLIGELVSKMSVDEWISHYEARNNKKTVSEEKNNKLYKMSFASIYPLYIKKVEKKGRTAEDVDTVIMWLTGYDKAGLMSQIEEKSSLEEFFDKAPKINPNVNLIKGVICGYRVEEIKETLMQKIRYMDKLVDELAKNKKMESILR